MRVLVTGAWGFVGRHVLNELMRSGHQPVAFDLPGAPECAFASAVRTFSGDVQDVPQLKAVVAESGPDACIHLGGMAFVPDGWSLTAKMFAVNAVGTINLLDVFRTCCPKARVLVVSSAEVYGRKLRPQAIREDEPLTPENPYAVAKAAADLMSLMYARQHGQPIMVARPYNHIGPGQSSRFVVPSLAGQLVAMTRGQAESVIKVGNLEGRREFTDVRDVARAYRLLLEKGQAGEAYNVASRQKVSIREILESLCDLSGVHPSIEVDPARYRPTEVLPDIDTAKIDADVGWRAEIPLSVTLRDVITETCEVAQRGVAQT